MSRPLASPFPSPWHELFQSCGSPKEAADQLGVPTRTMYSWARAERVPTSAAQGLLEAAFRAHGLRPPTWRGHA